MKKSILLLTVVVCVMGLAGRASAQALTQPDYWDGESWIFLNACPFDPGEPLPPANDPFWVDGFRFSMLDMDEGDGFYFTGVALPEGFGFDGLWFDVVVDEVVVNQVTPGPRGPLGSYPPGTVGLPPLTKTFEILGPVGQFLSDPDTDWDMFPVWLMWTPEECGADFAMTPLPEPATMSLLALGGVALLKSKKR